MQGKKAGAGTYIHIRLRERLSECLRERLSERLLKCLREYLSECLGKRLRECLSERLCERLCKRSNERLCKNVMINRALKNTCIFGGVGVPYVCVCL